MHWPDAAKLHAGFLLDLHLQAIVVQHSLLDYLACSLRDRAELLMGQGCLLLLSWPLVELPHVMGLAHHILLLALMLGYCCCSFQGCILPS